VLESTADLSELQDLLDRSDRDAGAAFDGWIEPRLMFAKR
jgi:hypothetical protein